MFFFASKLFWIVAAPASLACLLALLAFVARIFGLRRLSAFGLWTSALILVVAGATPLGPWGASVLENRYPARPTLPGDIAGILVLGGAIDTERSIAWGMPVARAELERVTSLVELGRRFPAAPIIYAGGYGGMATVHKVEAAFARDMLDTLGFDTTRVRFDERSRNTIENEVEARALAGGDIASRPWVLVTGAMHMPRAVAVFRKAGWKVIPWPVGPSTAAPGAPWEPLNLGDTLVVSTQAAREWVGLFAYYFAGHSERVLPLP